MLPMGHRMIFLARPIGASGSCHFIAFQSLIVFLATALVRLSVAARSVKKSAKSLIASRSAHRAQPKLRSRVQSPRLEVGATEIPLRLPDAPRLFVKHFRLCRVGSLSRLALILPMSLILFRGNPHGRWRKRLPPPAVCLDCQAPILGPAKIGISALLLPMLGLS